MKGDPQKEHQWLQRLVGNWTYEVDADMGPDKPRMKSTGSERVRSLGGLWVVCEGEGQMPDDGGLATTLMTLGYDPRVGRFVGTWVGSMMTHLWVYAGSLDASGKVLTLDTEGPNFADEGGKTLARFQDIIEFKGDDHRVLRSRTLTPDGEWNEFMNANYRRTG